MKTIKINSFRTITSIAFLALLLNISCAESTKTSTETAVNSTEVKTQVEAPSMDIQTAILSNNLEAVQQHIQAGTDLNKKESMTGSTPLITAASFGKKEIAKALIEAGVDLNLKNNDGSSALHSSAFFCRTEIVQMLLDAKADTTIKNNFGATALETVAGPFDQIKPIYEMLQQQLAPMGLTFELDKIEQTRPTVAKMLTK